MTDAAAAISTHAPALAHVGYAHFGPIAERSLDAILGLLQARGFALCSLSAALDHAVYRSFATDLTRNGLIVSEAPRDLCSRIRRRLELLVDRIPSFDRRRYGPLRPL